LWWSVKPTKYQDFSILKMAAFRHLGFFKIQNFDCQQAQKGQNVSLYQIS